MTPYKNFLAATNTFFNSNAFLKFLLSAYIFVIATGGLFFLLGLFILQALVNIGSILIWAGLILCIIKEDVLTIVISSGTLALGGLVAWIIGLAVRSYYYSGVFMFTPFFYFLVFGAIAIVVFLKADKFKQMRAASATQAPGYACPRCGGFVSMAAAFCPNCGAKRPEPQPYAPPTQPYAAPTAPVYPSSPVPPAAPVQATAPAQPYVAPAPPEAPPYPSSPVPPAAPVPSAEPVAPAAPVAEPAVGSRCAACGADLPEGAVFCGKCGAKQ